MSYFRGLCLLLSCVGPGVPAFMLSLETHTGREPTDTLQLYSDPSLISLGPFPVFLRFLVAGTTTALLVAQMLLVWKRRLTWSTDISIKGALLTLVLCQNFLRDLCFVAASITRLMSFLRDEMLLEIVSGRCASRVMADV